MVDSADEPPLSGHLHPHPWAKNPPSSSLQASSTTPGPRQVTANTASEQTKAHTVHQDALHTAVGPQIGGRPQSAPDAITPIQDTQQQDTSVVDKEGVGTQSTALENTTPKTTKDPLMSRFIRDVKLIIRSSWINWLLLIVPVAIVLGALVDWGDMPVVDQSVVFAVNAVAIVPLASLLAFATESVASKMGDTVGALMNVTFGNAVELIIFIIALVDGQVRVVQAAAVGSILSNLLIILGMSFLLGGLRFREQLYNSTVSQMSACLLCLSVISLLLPTAFHASFNDPENGDRMVLQVSRGTSIVLLLVYAIYLVFSLKSHSFMYASTPQHMIDEEAQYPGVLTQILNSSSSSDTSSSSDSDSDSSRSSRNTATRIKRAFRRKRRTSSPSSKAQSTLDGQIPRRSPPIANLETVGSQIYGQTHQANARVGSLNDEPVLSGDEADVDAYPRHGRRRSTRNTITRDFEAATEEQEDDKSKKRFRRHRKRAKRSKKENKANQSSNLDEKDQVRGRVQEAAPAVPEVRISAPDHVDDHAEKWAFNFRNISNHVGPAFPHHQAVARPLAMQAVRPMSGSRSPSRNHRLTRSSSMPDMIHPTISNDRAVLSPSRANRHIVPVEPSEDEAQEEQPERKRHLSRTSSIILLLVTTGFVAICAEFLVSGIDHIVSSAGIGQAFLGLIILPLVGNAAEHVTAVTVAYKNKMDLAIGIALGSSIQVAILITPFMVVLGWIIDQDMSLYFSLFETVSLFASAMIVGFLLIDGRSNYLEGALLVAAYIIIALGAFYYPNCGLSPAGGMPDSSDQNCSTS